jgi:hypothetical protein
MCSDAPCWSPDALSASSWRSLPRELYHPIHRHRLSSPLPAPAASPRRRGAASHSRGKPAPTMTPADGPRSVVGGLGGMRLCSRTALAGTATDRAETAMSTPRPHTHTNRSEPALRRGTSSISPTLDRRFNSCDWSANRRSRANLDRTRVGRVTEHGWAQRRTGSHERRFFWIRALSASLLPCHGCRSAASADRALADDCSSSAAGVS